MQEENLLADGLEKASAQSLQPEVTDPELKLFAAGQKDMHDLWHVVAGDGRDELGEACLLAFTYAQNKNRGVGFVAFVGCFKLFAKHRRNALSAILRGFRIGRDAAWLPGQEWVSLLANQLNNVREILNISMPSNYLASLND